MQAWRDLYMTDSRAWQRIFIHFPSLTDVLPDLQVSVCSMKQETPSLPISMCLLSTSSEESSEGIS